MSTPCCRARSKRRCCARTPQVKSGVEQLAAGDVGQPEDVARAIAYLASDDAAFVTGTGLLVDGGRLATL